MKRISKFLLVLIAITFAYGIGYVTARTNNRCQIQKTKPSNSAKPPNNTPSKQSTPQKKLPPA